MRGRGRLGVVVAVGAFALSGLAAQAPGVANAAKVKTVKVEVKLQEFKIRPSPKAAKAGNVTFNVKNVGSNEHEFVVVRADGATLPTAADGSVDEDQIAASAQIGEVEDVAPKKSGTLKVKGLEAGRYILFCNVVQEAGGTTVVHYARGMHTTFTVR